MRWLALLGIVFAAPATAAPDVTPSERVERNVVVRAGPSTETSAIDALDPGETVELVGDAPRWYEVRLPDGRTGYVSKSWTVLVEEIAGGGWRIHFIDVGTGLATFVEGPGFSLIYDAGSQDDTRKGQQNRALAYLRKVRPNLTTIDHLVLSHPHKDHLELMPDILEAFEVRHVWDSGRVNDTCGYLDFLERVAAEPGVTYHNAVADRAPHRVEFRRCRSRPNAVIDLATGSAIVRGAVPLGPGAGMVFLHVDGAQDHHDPNENTLVVRLDLGNRKILLAGDAEAGERRLPTAPPDPGSVEAELLACCRADLRADILAAGHHGSMTSSRTAFLDAVQASTYIVSSGPFRYGSVTLPDEVVVEEFDRRGSVWRTDRAGPGCRTDASKIGPDADGKAGGCDNIQISISASGSIQTRYINAAD